MFRDIFCTDDCVTQMLDVAEVSDELPKSNLSKN